MSAGTRYRLGPERGRLLLRTSRQGFATQVGHDLELDFSGWTADVWVADDRGASSVEASAQLTTLRVLHGTGGVKPLSEREKREIAQTARRLLDADHHPDARFVSRRVEPHDTGAVVDGTLTLRGDDRPFRLRVDGLGDGRYRASGRVVQSEYGITPYTAFFGALRVADPVEVTVEFELREPA